MNHHLIKKYLKRFVVIASVILLFFSIAGVSIISEGWHLFIAPTIENEKQLKESFDDFKYVNIQSNELQYTEMDIIFESQTIDKRFKGYTLKLDEKYIFIFRQDNVDQQSKMVLMPSYFSDENHMLFKESVYDQYAFETNTNNQQIRNMFINQVYVDVQGRVKEDTPIVILWILGFFVGISGLVMTLSEYLNFKQYKGKYAIFLNKKLHQINKNLLVSDRGFIVMKFGLRVLPFDEIMDVKSNGEELKIYFKQYVLQIKANESTIDSIYNTIFPEILTT